VPPPLLPLGILLTPRSDGPRVFDTTVLMARGEIDFTEDDLRALRDVWPPDAEQAPVAAPLAPREK
jgi:hypothetical protein